MTLGDNFRMMIKLGVLKLLYTLLKNQDESITTKALGFHIALLEFDETGDLVPISGILPGILRLSSLLQWTSQKHFQGCQ